jgi:hypothetical protein
MSSNSQRWFYWTFDVLLRFEAEDAVGAASAFRDRTGLTLMEWLLRTQGEYAHRFARGHSIYDSTIGIDAGLEECWREFSVLPVERYVDWCQSADGGEPHDLGPLAFRPILGFEDGRQMPISSEVLKRATNPNVVAQMISAVTDTPLDQVAAQFGRIGERLVRSMLNDFEQTSGLRLIHEDDIPGGGSKCDAVLIGDQIAAGMEITHITPKRYLPDGAPASADAYAERLSVKFGQVFSSLETLKDEIPHTAHPLAVLVQTTPAVWHPAIRERVCDNLRSEKSVASGDLRVVEVFDFRDLVSVSPTLEVLAEELISWKAEPYDDLDLYLHKSHGKESGVRTDAGKLNTDYVVDLLTRANEVD